MQEILLALTLGVIVGKLVRRQDYLCNISKGTLVGVAGLLFVMGAQIGSNPDVLSNLPLLGGKAFVFAVVSLTGALLLSLPITKRINK